MLKSQEMRLPDSCFNKAKADEPIFVLRGKDPIAAETIRSWVKMAAGLGLHADKIAEALKFADEMEAYATRLLKTPEAPR